MPHPPRRLRDGESPTSASATSDTDARDRAWIDAIRTGDDTALAALANAYADTLVRVARVVVHDDARAEEIVQDTLFAVWERRALLDIRGSVAGYLYSAVRHRAISTYRAERTRSRVRDELALQPLINNPVPAPDAKILERSDDELLAIVEHGLRQVAPQAREVFLLSWHAGLSYPEIAEQLGVAIRTVYNQMHRAVKALERTLPELLDS